MSARPITEDDLNAYVDQALDQARHGDVEAYLAANPDVARRIAAYGRDRDALRAALAPVAAEPAPPELNLNNLIAARKNAPAPWWRAVAAALLIGAGGLGGWSMHDTLKPSAGIAALAQEAAASYAVYAPDTVRPVEMRADAKLELVAWASQRLGYPVAIPDLSVAGFRFMGGRLIATAHGPGLLLMFDDDKGTRLVMLTRAMAVDRDKPMKEIAAGPATSFNWAQNGIGYSLIGPVTPAVLHPLANEIGKQTRSL
jgi:anti-sigma factor RsiW